MSIEVVENEMNEHRYQWGLTIARRMLFVVALSCIGSIAMIIFRTLNHPNQGPPRPVAVFVWGAASMWPIVAIWLVTRSGVWTSWLGWLRAGLYIVAFLYGIVLYDFTQRVLIDWVDELYLPGSKLEDFPSAISMMIHTLAIICLLIPLAMVGSAALVTTDQVVTRRGRFSISGLIGFITTIALVLGCTQFLTSDYSPWDKFNQQTPQQLQLWLGTRLLFHLPPLLASMLIMYGLSKRWWWAFAALPAAIAIDALGSRVVTYLAEQINGEQSGNILSDSHISCWMYVSGRSLTMWIALCMARLLGVKPYFGRRKEEAIEDEPEVSSIDAP
ncbi:hypothetical protein GC197_03260 [bacterium]|nr:hypothetical protein [bacterium]